MKTPQNQKFQQKTKMKKRKRKKKERQNILKCFEIEIWLIGF